MRYAESRSCFVCPDCSEPLAWLGHVPGADRYCCNGSCASHSEHFLCVSLDERVRKLEGRHMASIDLTRKLKDCGDMTLKELSEVVSHETFRGTRSLSSRASAR